MKRSPSSSPFGVSPKAVEETMEPSKWKTVAFASCVLFTGCARAGAAPEDVASARADVAVPREDAGGSRERRDAPRADSGTRAPRIDAGMPDVPPDAPLDAGPPGSSCLAAIDVSAGGTFSFDVCALPDSAGATCGVDAAFDLVVFAEAPEAGSAYELVVPDEWVIQQVDERCRPLTLSCGATGTWAVSGATFPPRWYFAISRITGGCGRPDVVVRRIL